MVIIWLKALSNWKGSSLKARLPSVAFASSKAWHILESSWNATTVPIGSHCQMYPPQLASRDQCNFLWFIFVSLSLHFFPRSLLLSLDGDHVTRGTRGSNLWDVCKVLEIAVKHIGTSESHYKLYTSASRSFHLFSLPLPPAAITEQSHQIK